MRWSVAAAAAVLSSCVRQTTERRAWPAYPLAGAERPVFAAALARVLDSLPADAAPVCVRIRGPRPAYWYVPDEGMRRQLGTRRTVLAGDRCPPTYETMMVVVDSTGRPLASRRPPGYVDPHGLDVAEQSYWLPDSARLLVHAMQGTRGTTYHCVTRRAEARWVATCRAVRTFFSEAPSREALQLTRERRHAARRWRPSASAADAAELVITPGP